MARAAALVAGIARFCGVRHLRCVQKICGFSIVLFSGVAVRRIRTTLFVAVGHAHCPTSEKAEFVFAQPTAFVRTVSVRQSTQPAVEFVAIAGTDTPRRPAWAAASTEGEASELVTA
jgi:hypothetical protein